MPSQSFSHLKLQRADGFWRRFAGLMLKPSLDADAGLLIPNCPSVHTFFMRFVIDVIYLDQKGRVVKLEPGLKPWRVSGGGRRARHAIEVAAGAIESMGVRIGDALQ